MQKSQNNVEKKKGGGFLVPYCTARVMKTVCAAMRTNM